MNEVDKINSQITQITQQRECWCLNIISGEECHKLELKMICNWHLKDTRWGENPTAVAIHSLVIDINENEFCMIDYTVNALDGYKHQWTSENVQKAIDYCKPILKVMGLKGKVTIKGISFPATDAKV